MHASKRRRAEASGVIEIYSDGEFDEEEKDVIEIESDEMDVDVDDQRVEDMVEQQPARPAGAVDYHWKHFFLTYSQAGDLTKERVHAFFVTKEGPNINKLLVGAEYHQDGGRHFHVYVEFTNRKRIRNPRVWDIEGVHPNIQKVKNPRKCMDYCIKDGDYLGDWELARHNYRKEAADTAAWQYDRRSRMRPAVQWPIRVPGGGLQLEPRLADKRCNWWIISEPDAGKTYWSQSYFGTSAVFDVPLGDKYRFEGYRGERVIIYDDVMPEREELLRLCNVWTRPAEVPYSCRYTRAYLPVNTRLVVIVLSNAYPEYEANTAIRARFHFVSVSKEDIQSCLL